VAEDAGAAFEETRVTTCGLAVAGPRLRRHSAPVAARPGRGDAARRLCARGVCLAGPDWAMNPGRLGGRLRGTKPPPGPLLLVVLLRL
jgi:hypothetical protein